MRCVSKGTMWVCALGLLFAAPVIAQELPTMTLDEAIQIARDRNPQYLSALARVDASTVGVRSAYGAFFPSLNVGMTWGGFTNTTLTAPDDFGRTITLDEPITVRQSSASQGLSSSVTLFDGFRNLNQLRSAKQDVIASHAGVDVQGLQVDADVSQRFYDALRAQKLVAVEEQLLASAEEQLEANERLFRVASATQVDVLGAQVDLASRQQALTEQVANAQKARLQVLQTLGVLGEIMDFQPVGDFPAIFDPGVLDADELVGRAFGSNPIIAQRTAEHESAQRASAGAKGSWLPSVTVNGQWSRSLQAQNFGAVFNANPGQNRGYNFNIQVSWQLFDGFQRSLNIANANATLRQAAETDRLARLELEQQVRAALIDLQSAYNALQIQERATALSRRRVDFAREQFRQSAIDFTSLQQIIGTASTQERNLVDARYNFAVRLVLLEQQVGERVQPRG